MKMNPFKKIYDICNLSEPSEKNANIKDFPIYMDIELTNYCNFSCLMCPTGTGSIKRSQGFMSDEVYYKILNEIKEKDVALRFIRWGEPTLHKNFFKYIEAAKQIGLLCHVNTNGLLMDEKLSRKLIDLKLDSIKFSFQGTDDISYNEMRCGGDFIKLIETIKRFHMIRGDRELPYIHVATTTTYETDKMIEDFKKSVQPYCDLVTVGKTMLSHIDIENANMKESSKVRLNELIKEESYEKVRLNCCPEVFDKLSVNWNGDVTGCCSDYDGKMLLGNVKRQSIQEIWRCEKLKHYREILSRRGYDEIEQCKDCYDLMYIQR